MCPSGQSKWKDAILEGVGATCLEAGDSHCVVACQVEAELHAGHQLCSFEGVAFPMGIVVLSRLFFAMIFHMRPKSLLPRDSGIAPHLDCKREGLIRQS